MKIILPWVLFLGAALGAGYFHHDNQSKTAELARLQAQLQALEQLKTEVEKLRTGQIAPEELERLYEARTELLRLRNQVQQLTRDKAQLNQEAQTARTQASQAQAKAEALAQAQTELARQNEAEVRAQMSESCINNLRLLAAATQQWALENGPPANLKPAEPDLVAYLKDGTMPACPAGGKYTLNAVGALPTCSIPGHVLPGLTQ
ncbi:MAG TPA: hypothetical protein PKN95_15250 [Verrucomicrobiota bacterium]|nr:hypothetical protein [Verrucomicrobiota bacterium]HNT13463.1 hypothetical protein [Verrucomicrobiota bacterium]